MYQVCGHCDKIVSQKTFKEHRHLFFQDHQWIKEVRLESRASTALSVSDPPESMSGASQHEPEDDVHIFDEDDTTSFPAFEDFTPSPELGKGASPSLQGNHRYIYIHLLDLVKSMALKYFYISYLCHSHR